MSEQTPEERRDDPYEMYCPECGHDGTFDGQGHTTETVTTYQAGDDAQVEFERRWSQHRCPACDATFRVVDAIDETDREAPIY